MQKDEEDRDFDLANAEPDAPLPLTVTSRVGAYMYICISHLLSHLYIQLGFKNVEAERKKSRDLVNVGLVYVGGHYSRASLSFCSMA